MSAAPWALRQRLWCEEMVVTISRKQERQSNWTAALWIYKSVKRRRRSMNKDALTILPNGHSASRITIGLSLYLTRPWGSS